MLVEYRCKECGHEFENLETPSVAECSRAECCPKCKGSLKRLFSVPNLKNCSQLNDNEPKIGGGTKRVYTDRKTGISKYKE